MTNATEDFWNKEVTIREVKSLLDTEQVYRWQLVKREYRPGVIFHRDAPTEYRGKQLVEIEEDERAEIQRKWTADLIELHFRIADDDAPPVVIRETSWLRGGEGGHSETVLTINPNNPGFQSRIVTLIQKMGHTLQHQQKLRLGDYFPIGLEFEANPQQQRGKDGKETGFHQLNIDTIANVKKVTQVQPMQMVQMAITVSAEQRTEIHAIVTGLDPAERSKEDVVRHLVKIGKSFLITAYFEMDKAGEFTPARGKKE